MTTRRDFLSSSAAAGGALLGSATLSRAFFEAARAAIKADVKFTFVDDYDFLTEHKIDKATPWAMLKDNDDGMMSVKNARAIKGGLPFRPLADTVRDTLAWWPTVPEARRSKPRVTNSAEAERKALADWHARKGG